MSVTDTDTARTASPHRSSRPTWWQSIGAAAVAATVVNLLIFLLAGAGGASFEIVDQGARHLVTVPWVVGATVVPLMVGSGLAVLLGLWWHGFIRLAQIVGAALALLSAASPLIADTDTATQWSLATMHGIAGVAAIAALETVRRRAQ